MQTVDNIDKIGVLKDSGQPTPPLRRVFTRSWLLNVGLDYRGPRNWFARAGVNFNYYDNLSSDEPDTAPLRP